LEAADAPQQRNCAICGDDHPVEETYHYERCLHSYCLQCLTRYYSTRILDGDVLSISCPDTHCDTEVTPSEIEAVVEKDLFDKYNQFLRQAKMKLEPDSRWCPKPDCDTIVKGNAETQECRCTNSDCGFVFCFTCSLQWHPDISCDELAKRQKNLKDKKRVDKWKKKHKTKPCPMCRADIEKDKGCNHMSCSSCTHQFCWLCMRKYTADHYNLDNLEGCPGRCFDIPKSVVRKRQLKNVVIGTTMVSAAVVLGAVSLVILVPVLIISAPFYGGYKLRQHSKKKTK